MCILCVCRCVSVFVCVASFTRNLFGFDAVLPYHRLHARTAPHSSVPSCAHGHRRSLQLDRKSGVINIVLELGETDLDRLIKLHKSDASCTRYPCITNQGRGNTRGGSKGMGRTELVAIELTRTASLSAFLREVNRLKRYEADD